MEHNPTDDAKPNRKRPRLEAFREKTRVQSEAIMEKLYKEALEQQVEDHLLQLEQLEVSHKRQVTKIQEEYDCERKGLLGQNAAHTQLIKEQSAAIATSRQTLIEVEQEHARSIANLERRHAKRLKQTELNLGISIHFEPCGEEDLSLAPRYMTFKRATVFQDVARSMLERFDLDPTQVHFQFNDCEIVDRYASLHELGIGDENVVYFERSRAS